MHIRSGALMALMLLVGAGVLAETAKPPVVAHDPAKVAIRGQPLSVIAKVTPGAAALKSVNLYYTLSKDAAPFKVTMQSSGASIYYGSIPGHLLGSVQEVSYYIEALDEADGTGETDWFTLPVKDAASAEPAPPPAAVRPPAPAPMPPAQQVAPSVPEKKSKTGTVLTVGLIGAGAAAVVGSAIYLANRSSSGGDGPSPADLSGTYAGTETLCYGLEGTSPECSRNTIRIVIDQSGVVRSDTLWSGASLEGRLNGSSFVLVASVNEPATNRTGEIFFSGNVVDGRILGSIDGSATEPSGKGLYTGTFTANKI